jgi:hypothetical protein
LEKQLKSLRIAVAILVAGVAVVFFLMRRNHPRSARPPSVEEEIKQAHAQAERLPALEGYSFEVRYSATAREQATRLADLTSDAYAYFAGLFPGVSPTIMATFLTPADWTQGYGMPSYYPPAKRLRVATDDNPFWRSFRKRGHGEARRHMTISASTARWGGSRRSDHEILHHGLQPTLVLGWAGLLPGGTKDEADLRTGACNYKTAVTLQCPVKNQC